MRYSGKSFATAKVALTVATIVLVAAAVAAEPPGTWATKTDLPENLFFAATAEVNGIIYVIGGSPGAEFVGTVYAYDPHVGSTSKDLNSSLGFDVWSTKTAMSAPRAMAATAVVDGRIYVIGGAIDGDFTAANTVEAYDPASDSWEALTDMPTALWSPAAAAVDGKIYVIGGGTGDALGEHSVFASVHVYDPATDSWDTAADMPTARAILGASAVGNLIYAVGGDSGGESILSRALEVYNTATDTWTVAADMPTPRDAHATVAVDGKVYAFGGLAWGSESSVEVAHEVEVYDPSTNSWERSTRMPDQRWGLGAAVVDGTIYLIGGARTTMTIASSYTDAYDPNLYTYWTEVTAHLPGAHGSQWRTDLCAANFNGETANVELVLHADTGDVHETYTIDPSQQKSFADVVGNMGIEGKGALEFRADQHLRMAGRTFNEDGAGTFGQFCDFQTMDNGFFAGDEVYMIGLRQEEGLFRTNLTFANTGIRKATMYIDLYRCSGGSSLHTIWVVDLMPGEVRQELKPFTILAGEPNVGWGYAKVTIVEGAGVRISASVIDSRTNDATTIVAEH